MKMNYPVDRTKKFTVITFEITNNCNKNCNYCIQMYKKNRKIEYMTIDDYIYVVSCINKIDRENFREIIITGGEPLLHPNVITFIKLIRDDFPKAEIIIQSNGKLLKKLSQKNLRIFSNIKNIIFNISHYPGWNDDEKKIYDNNYKLPNFWKRIVNKITLNNRFMDYVNLDYRFPIIKKIRRFLIDPLKKGNVYFGEYTGFRYPYDNPNLSNEIAKNVRNNCHYYILILGRKLYNCCISKAHESYYNTDPVGIKFDKNWKKNYFKLATWKACVHCRLGTDRYKFINLESKLGHSIDLKTKFKITKFKDHR